MTRPRKPFGSTQPGRLPATMVKVLAAELSDPSRHRKGKQYANDGSVLDIIIEPGIVTCEIQGSRSMPYVASIEVLPGSGMPLRRDLTCSCSCPDDDNWGGHACKHVVAALYTLSNEFLIEPELLDVWRNNSDSDSDSDSERRRRRDDEDEDDDEDDDLEPDAVRGTRRHLSIVRDIDDEPAPRPPSVFEDPLKSVLRLQPGTELPDIPQLEQADLRSPRDRDLATALRDALAHVRVDWD
ncbi:SWIM zinc finger family protein [Ilumatobacter sp.]|uniref:SWIM zinc finger family protein n=2 Tax=Ilumatobacter sp. TaxID=1967498 RepID=UPI003750BF94